MQHITIEDMTKYYPHRFSLSVRQKSKLAKAYQNNSPITIRFPKNELNGVDKLILTKTQISKIKKPREMVMALILKFQKHKLQKLLSMVVVFGNISKFRK